MIGSIDLKVRITLNQDVTPEVARRFVEELDYQFSDTTGEVSISDTEIVDDNVDDFEGG